MAAGLTLADPLLGAFSDVLLEVYRAAHTLGVQEFPHHALTRLQAQLPFDAALWGCGTVADHGVHVHHTCLFHVQAAMLQEYDAIQSQDPTVARLAQSPRATVCLDRERDFAQPEHATMLAFLRRWGHEHILISSEVDPNTRFAHWISLYRYDAQQAFTDLEAHVLARLTAHLQQALTNNRRHYLEQLSSHLPAADRASAILDTQGHIYYLAPGFAALVGLPWGDAAPTTLPPELLRALTQGQCSVPVNAAVVQIRQEADLLFVKARPREAVDKLSAREFLIARLLASGLTQREVATRLQRSPETIRSQVRSIFAKLDIKNIVMLPERLKVRDE